MTLQQALDDAVRQGTFSLDAIEAIKNMKEHNETLKKNAAADKESIKVQKQANSRMTEENVRLHKDLEAANKRLTNIEDREKKMTLLECEALKHAAVAAAVNGCFEKVFRNPVLQSNVFRDSMQTGGYDERNNPIQRESGHTETKTVE